MSLVHATVAVLENVRLARDTYRIRLHCPELARAFRPGQFLMLRLPGSTDPLLGRPFALYDTVLDTAGDAAAVDVVYLVVGKLTGLLKDVKAGAAVAVWGPLGNGFPDLPPLEHIGLVAGGIGQTPSWPMRGNCSAAAATEGGQPGARPSACRCSTACGRRNWPRASRTSATSGRTCDRRATMAASASRAS